MVGSHVHVAFNFEGGYEYKLLAVDRDNTKDELAQICADIMVGCEVRPKPGRILRIRRQEDDKPYPRDMRIRDTGWIETEPIVVYYE
jgi:toluene monooxygenase system protein B